MKSHNRVLIVEDDTLIALDISNALASFGYEVCATVDSGERAIASAAELHPNIILMDIGLRGRMDGIEAAKIISASESIPIVFLTADEEESTLQRAKLILPYGYIIKPFDPKELRSVIEITLYRSEVSDGAGQRQLTDSESQIQAKEVVEPYAEIEDRIGSTRDRIGILTSLPLFGGTDRVACEKFADSASERHCEAGVYLVNEGSDPEGGFVVLNGRVSLTKTSFDGKELIVASLGPGDTIGLLYALDSFALSTGARCQIESRVLWFSAKSFADLRSSSSILCQRFIEELAGYMAVAHQLSSSLAHSKVEGRIIATLIALLPHFGKSGAAANQGRIYMTRRELADLVGTSPETAIRVTKTLERAELLDLTRPGIIKIVDLKGLGDYGRCH